MKQMPLLALILYVSALVALDGPMPSENTFKLLGRAGILFTARDIIGDDYAAEVRKHPMPSFEGFFEKN